MTYRVLGGQIGFGIYASPEAAVCDGLRRMDAGATIDGLEAQHWAEGCWTTPDAVSYLLARLSEGDGLFGVRITASGRSLPVWQIRTTADRDHELRKRREARKKRRGQ